MKRSSLAATAALAALLLLAAAPCGALDPVPLTGFQKDLLASIDDAGQKLVALAKSTPEDKFAWRPDEGVRSVREVYLHVVAGNYLIPSLLGTKRPEGIDRNIEKSAMDKTKVIELLQKSIADLQTFVASYPDAELDKKAKFFDTEKTARGLLLTVANHMHEHLGQSIAYARMNRIVPPWSEGGPEKK